MKNKRIKEPEKTIQDAILQWLVLNKIKAFRINSGMVKTEKGGMVKLAPTGFSDIFGVLTGGRAFFIEVKTDKGKLTKFQTEFLGEMKELGAITIVARRIEDCEEIVKSRGAVTAGKRQ